MSKIYPIVSGNKEPVVLDKSAVAEKIIALRESGAPADYSGFSEGQDLDRVHVISLAAKQTRESMELDSIDDLSFFEKVYDQIENERVSLSSVSPVDFATATEYKEELSRRAEIIDTDVWYTKLLAANEVTKFTDLKTELTPVESVGEIG